MFLRTDTISILNSKVECNLKLVPCPNDVERPNENNLCARREHKKKTSPAVTAGDTERASEGRVRECQYGAKHTHTLRIVPLSEYSC